MTQLLELSDIRCSFGDTAVLNGATFSVSKGETVGVIGPNGSGKTTLFNCVSGFVDVSSGVIRFKGEEIQKLEPAERAIRGIGRIFQSYGIFREMTVLENMIIALEGRTRGLATLLPGGKAFHERVMKAHELLEQVKLGGKAKQKAGSLSGGQMRLLEIARTKAFGAELFLLDEPTAGVSPKMKDEVVELVRSLQREGHSVVVIEHDMTFIQQFCSRIVVLDVGRVVLDGTPERVRSDPILQEVYFGRKVTAA